MNNENIDKQKLMEALLSSSGGRIDKKQRKRRGKRQKNIAPLVNSLSSEDREKLNAAMSDKKALKKRLKARRRRRFLKSILKGGGKNG